MKKIAILTFVNTVNYGAILQATALQYFLSKKNFEVNNLNYCVEHQGLENRPLYKLILTKTWNIIKLFLGYKRRLKKTNKFIKSNLNLTERIINPDDLLKYNNLYDCFIVGSDQVWNPKIIGKDMSYFLSFASDRKMKISYAASFGLNSLPLDYFNNIYDPLKNFSSISVREKQGQNILNTMGIKSEVVLDPTLLLSEDDWRYFYSEDRLIKEKYILCYFMPGNKVLEKKITEISDYLSKQTGYKIINIGKKEYSVLNIKRTNRVTDGPKEFLNLIVNSEYVLTNSFHGLAFSLNFNKKVYPFVERNFSEDISLSSRLISILELTGCKNRIIYSDSTYQDFLNIKDIDFSKVNSILELNRSISSKFICDSLKGL